MAASSTSRIVDNDGAQRSNLPVNVGGGALRSSLRVNVSWVSSEGNSLPLFLIKETYLLWGAFVPRENEFAKNSV